MKNKGFTLVELLGVVVILVVIFLLVFPSVNKILFTSKETVYQTQINKILNAAYDFSLKNTNYLPSRGNKSYITLGELKTEGLIDFNIENPQTKKNFEDNLVISIHNVGANYKYSNLKSKLEGDYLYTIEEEKNNNNLLPTILLEGLEPNSNGEYKIDLELNDEYNEYNVVATSSNGMDLTDKVVKYILKNNEVEEEIDTTKIGIYKIIYTVVDNNGYSKTLVLNIIIKDTTLPEILNLENTTIGKDIKSFDLLEGIVCQDNSGHCDITTSGIIKFGVADKYIIEYIAKDPSGNTFTKERVITVE